MSTKRYKPEQVVNILRQIEVEIANGKTTPQACRDACLGVASVEYAIYNLVNPRVKFIRQRRPGLWLRTKTICLRSYRPIHLFRLC